MGLAIDSMPGIVVMAASAAVIGPRRSLFQRPQPFRHVQPVRFRFVREVLVHRRPAIDLDVSCSFLRREFDNDDDDNNASGDDNNASGDNNNASGDKGRSCSVYRTP
jgi:hypothetical protein